MINRTDDEATASRTTDASRIRKKTFLYALSSPLTLWPSLVGSTMLLVNWAFELHSGGLSLGGLAGVLGGLGICVTRLLMDSEKLTKAAMREILDEERRRREESLDDLHRKLVSDDDPRTERLLADLRALDSAFKDEKIWPAAMNAQSRFDLRQGIEKLFSRCLQLLEKSIELQRIAKTISIPTAREPIIAQRERMIDEVGNSVKQLGVILAELQTISVAVDSSGNSEISDIRRELDMSLEVAQQIEKRMRAINRELDETASVIERRE